jgi:methionyl-tRNA synthetase
MDIRTGTILEAEKMPKNKKLLILKVDTGIDVRTIVSGIAESLNQKILLETSDCFSEFGSKPSRRGSQGMILMTTNAEGKLVL